MILDPDGTIHGVHKISIINADEISKFYLEGVFKREVSETEGNINSSRSHLLFTIEI